jgi:hypothetical protein
MDGPVRGCSNCEGERGLDGGFVPTWEAPACFCGGKLGDGSKTIFAILTKDENVKLLFIENHTK